jgi:MFS family permease
MHAPSDDPNLPWYKGLTSYHWFVFIMASMAWVFDCLDQQVFILARNAAMANLLPKGTDTNLYGGYATAIFIAGWATGGLIFGAIGDRVGRARTLTITVLMYSIFTGLSALSKGWLDFAIYRFVTGLGVGGVVGLAVALIADTLPDRSRVGALGAFQALSAIGNITAGLVSIWMGSLLAGKHVSTENSWKWMFLIGAAPAFICVLVQLRMKEPEKWVQARAEGRRTGIAFGSYASLFGIARWRHNAIWGMLLCVAGVIGLWGIGFFAPELVGPVIERSLRATQVSAENVAGAKAWWIGWNSIFQNLGAVFGMLFMARLMQSHGRKMAFAIGFIAAFVATIGYFQFFNGWTHVFWMTPIMGACQLSLFAGFAIYLPELFPIRLRSTGTSFCYNVGRFIAATGPLLTGKLQAIFRTGAATPDQKIDAFRNAASYMSVIFLLGLVVLLFLPETKGQPLPEDDVLMPEGGDLLPAK